jgi:hypothetical protein
MRRQNLAAATCLPDAFSMMHLLLGGSPCATVQPGWRSLYSLSPLNRMHTLVTDSGADPGLVEAIRACGPEVIVAS